MPPPQVTQFLEGPEGGGPNYVSEMNLKYKMDLSQKTKFATHYFTTLFF